MARKILILIGLLWGVGLLLAIGLTVIHRGGGVTQKAVPNTFASAVAYGKNALIYSNGKGLESYNYTNGQSKILGATSAGLQSIDTMSVSPNNNYILFHDEELDQGGALAAQLRQQGLEPTLDYWWLYNVQNQLFQALPQGVLVANLDNDHVYTLSASAGAESITTYAIRGLQQTSVVTIPGSSNFFVGQNGFLLQTADNKVLLTSDGVVNNVLLQSAILVGVTADKQSAVAVVTKNNARELVDINLNNDTTSTIASGIVNLPVWLSSGTVLYATKASTTSTTQQFYSYNLTTRKIVLWKLGGDANHLGETGTNLVALVGPNTAIVSNSSNNYYLLGSNLISTKTIQKQ
jgi:hypothetical protein